MKLPEFKPNEIMIEAVRRTSHDLSKQRRFAFHQQWKHVEVGISEDSLSGFANGTRNPTNLDDVTRAMWALFSERFPATLYRHWKEVTGEALVGSDPVTNALHQFWLPGSTLDHTRLSQLKGHFAAFVPFFLNKRSIQLMALECGVADDPGQFNLEMRYTADDGKDRTDIIEGRIVPCAENLVFIGQIVGQLTPYIFSLSNLPIFDGKIERGEGATMVASRAARSSASPIICIRRDERPDPEVIAPEGASQAIPEWRLVERVMSRGYVDWQ